MLLTLQDIGDVVIGSVLGDSSQRAIQVRIAGFLAGIPENVPVHTVNRYVGVLLSYMNDSPCRFAAIVVYVVW